MTMVIKYNKITMFAVGHQQQLEQFLAPWMIPFNVSQISGTALLDLPMEITVYNKTYKLGGFSVHAAEHYTAVTFLYSKAYYTMMELLQL